jgi:4-carboxymuconolactone decarboxylase
MLELSILQVAHHAESAFQVAAHERIAYDAGFTHDQLAALRDGRQPELGDPAERTVWRTVDRLVTTGDLDDVAYAEAVSTLGEAATVELVTVVGYYLLLALQLRVFRVPVQDYRGPRVPGR